MRTLEERLRERTSICSSSWYSVSSSQHVEHVEPPRRDAALITDVNHARIPPIMSPVLEQSHSITVKYDTKSPVTPSYIQSFESANAGVAWVLSAQVTKLSLVRCKRKSPVLQSTYIVHGLYIETRI